jgi:hypothetical protein
MQPAQNLTIHNLSQRFFQLAAGAQIAARGISCSGQGSDLGGRQFASV